MAPDTPVTPQCSPQCVQLWQKAEQEHPKCMRIFAVQTLEESDFHFQMTKELVKASKDERLLIPARALKTFAEVCLDHVVV